MRLEIMLPGYSVWLRVWQVQVGRELSFYLLDSNDAANFPAIEESQRTLWRRFELRLKQDFYLDWWMAIASRV